MELIVSFNPNVKCCNKNYYYAILERILENFLPHMSHVIG